MAIITLNCLVLGDKPKDIFPVQISQDDTVGILKDRVIQQNPAAHFRDVGKIGQIHLLKLKVPLLCNDTLAGETEALDIKGQDKLDQMSEVISNLFEAPSPGHLHVIALPPDVPRKRARSSTGDDSPSPKRPTLAKREPYLKTIYNALWKREFPENVQQFNPFRKHKAQADTSDTLNPLEDASAREDDIEVLDFSPLRDLAASDCTGQHCYTQLLVRKSYHEFRQYVENIVQKEPVRGSYIMLLGHPGIGKTPLLFVILCWCLQAKTPVYYQPLHGEIWFFNEDGCEVLGALDFPRHRKRQTSAVPHYYLFDLNYTQSLSEIRVVERTVFIVSTLPATNYRGWAKRIGDMGALTQWWMEPWTEAEIMHYAQFRGDDLEAIQRVFTRFGGSARLCFARKGPDLSQAEREQDGEIDQIVNSPTMMMGALSELPFSPHEEWTSTVAAAFPRVVGGEVDRHFPITQIASVYAATQLASRARPNLVEFIFKRFGELCQDPWIAGKVFETFAHRTLERGLEAELRGLSTPEKVTVTLRVNRDRSFDTGNLNITEKTYLRPTSSAFTGIDSLLLDQDGVLNLFQITINAPRQVNSVFLDHIPNAYRTKMRLIFVMPVEEGGKMERQDIFGGNDELDVEKIPQFVLKLTCAQVQAAVRR